VRRIRLFCDGRFLLNFIQAKFELLNLLPSGWSAVKFDRIRYMLDLKVHRKFNPLKFRFKFISRHKTTAPKRRPSAKPRKI